jgi:cell division protein FtsB
MKFKNIITGVFVLSLLMLCLSIFRNVLQMLKAEKRLDLAQQKVDSLQTEQQQLIQDKSRQDSVEYVESQIRNKLKLIKPGETMVILPSILQDEKKEEVYKYSPSEEIAQKDIPPYTKWLALFF